jgi:xylulokinase
VKDNISNGLDYPEMNEAASKIPIGSDGLSILPFGNGAERILQNKQIGASIQHLNFNVHTKSHFIRAAQEGIAFSLKYGFDMMLDNGVSPKVIRAGKANMFLSPIFGTALVNSTQTPVELYDTDGAKGAALAGGYGANQYTSIEDAMSGLTLLQTIEPQERTFEAYTEAYQNWNNTLTQSIK